MPPSRDAQRKHVVIGLALGVLLEGVDAVSSDKMKFAFAFNRAWSAWPKANNFRGISGPFPGDFIWGGLSKSANRQMAFAAWDGSQRGWWIAYSPMEGITLQDAVEIHSDERAIEADWRHLARLFIEALGDEGVGVIDD
ncbi:MULTISPECIES: hypothetical protein [unclassified Aeromicrobium]|jgi:hypothetical protein|uniref:hypothetical protein n=1 Tax=unclassified Aeromicrobium TaxID=2633570 RepID=UPI000A4A9A13|nr:MULTISPECIES: hypothetical protein [unclassified Aeromicrobium]